MSSSPQAPASALPRPVQLPLSYPQAGIRVFTPLRGSSTALRRCLCPAAQPSPGPGALTSELSWGPESGTLWAPEPKPFPALIAMSPGTVAFTGHSHRPHRPTEPQACSMLSLHVRGLYKPLHRAGGVPGPPRHPLIPPAEKEFFRDASRSHMHLPGPSWNPRLPPRSH